MNVDHLKRIYKENQIDDVYIKKFKEKIYNITNLNLLSLRYKDIAICNYLLDNNIIECKKNLYIYSKLRQEIINQYQPNSIISSSYVKMNNLFKILEGIISDNWNTVLGFAKIIGGRKNEEKDDSPFTYHFGYALKYIILDDYKNAENYIEKLISLRQKKVYKLYAGYIYTLNGIYESDEIKVIEGLNEMIIQYKRRRDLKDMPEEYICLHAIGLAKLALKKGLDIQFEHELAPKVLIDFHEIDYPEIEVLKYLD